MKFVEAVHLIFQQAPTVLAALGSSTKIFQSFVTPATAMPFIVISAQSDSEASPTLVGNDRLRVATIAVDCVHSSLSSAAAIANAVRVDLHGASGNILTTQNLSMQIQSVRIEGTGLSYDMGGEGTEYGAFICSVTLKIYYKTSATSPVALTDGMQL